MYVQFMLLYVILKSIGSFNHSQKCEIEFISERIFRKEMNFSHDILTQFSLNNNRFKTQ